ncbi:MAG TPA: hypothetical protein VF731_03750 [Solirubrobacterales bacterium]
MRARLTPGVFALLLALSGCGSGHASSDSTRTAPAAPKAKVTLTAATHRPRAGAPWPIVIRAFGPDGRPLSAEVRYQYLFAGQVVAHRSHYRFRGVFHDTFRWPARSLGIPLTFRAVVTTPLGTTNLDYAVRVRR